MKRILAILCVIAVLCGLCVPAMAAGTITVSVKSSWSQVNLYVWENDTPMEGWPGTAMTKGANGLWTLQIPAGSYTNVIANDGSSQTADLKMDGSADCWIDADAGVVYTDAAMSKPFGGNAGGNNGGNAGSVDLSGLRSLALVGDGMPGFVEGWNPGAPAGDMVKESAGVYTKVVTVLAGTDAKFKIAGNDEWNDAYNFGGAEDGVSVVLGTKINLTNGGGSKDITLKVSKDCNLKFTVDLNEMTVLVVETTEEAGTTPSNPGTSEPTGETYTVYAKVPADWKNPAIWCWNDSDSNPPSLGAWPGTLTMKKGADGWYSAEVPVGYNNLLINANGGGNKTPDILGCGGKDVWINAYTNPNEPVYSYEQIPDEQIGEPTTAPHVETTIRPTEGLKPSGNTQATQGTQATDAENGSNKADVKNEIVENDITVLLIVIGSVVVLGAVVVVFVIMKAKQKKA